MSLFHYPAKGLIRVNDADHRAPIVLFVNDHVTRQKNAQAKVFTQRFVRKARVTRPENPVPAKPNAKLGLERLVQVDLRNDPKALGRQRLGHKDQGLVVTDGKAFPSALWGFIFVCHVHHLLTRAGQLPKRFAPEAFSNFRFLGVVGLLGKPKRKPPRPEPRRFPTPQRTPLGHERRHATARRLTM